MKIAILDDYQNVALSIADWSAVEKDAKITVFNRHLGNLDTAAAVLADYEIISLMRERTPFPREMFEKLPKLRLLLTSGHFNSAIDMDAANDHGVVVCGTATIGRTTVEQTWALLMTAARNTALEDRVAARGRLAGKPGADVGEQDPRAGRPGSARRGDRGDPPRFSA